MAIPPKGKKEYKVYLDENETEYVKSFLISTKNTGGLSGVMNSYIKTMSKTLRLSGFKNTEKVTAKVLLKMAYHGIKQDIA